VPEKQFIGKTELKENPTFDPHLHLPNKAKVVARANFQMNINKKDTQQNTPILDPEFVAIMGNTLAKNPLVNNLVYRGTADNNGDTYMFQYTER
jgi:hypothetical protein